MRNWWIAANAIGAGTGFGLAAPLLIGWLNPWNEALFGLVVGLVLGPAQLAVVWQRLRQAGWWLLATSGGWLLGSGLYGLAALFTGSGYGLIFETAITRPLVGAVNGAFYGATCGIMMGAAQWLVLRRSYAVRWWPLRSALAWAAAGAIVLGLGLGALFEPLLLALQASFAFGALVSCLLGGIAGGAAAGAINPWPLR